MIWMCGLLMEIRTSFCMALRQILCFCVAWRRNFVGKTMSVMKLDPEFSTERM